MKKNQRNIRRVALVGAGAISQRHLRAWQKLEDIDVVAIAEPDNTKAYKRADEFDHFLLLKRLTQSI